MPIKIDMNALRRIGKPDTMVDETLDRLIQSADATLGKKARGMGNQFLALFENNAYRVQLTEAEIVEKMKAQKNRSVSKIQNVIAAFVEQGLLRQLPNGRYELVNNFVAKQANKKLEAEKRILLSIRNTIQDRMTRDELLNRRYLNYIAPSLPQLELTKDEKKFITRSKRRVNLRFWALIALLSLIFTALGVMYFNAESNLKKAEEAKEKLAVEQANTESARLDAVAAQKNAEEAREDAENARDEALEQKVIADQLRIEAEGLRRLAELGRDSLEQRKREEEKLRLAAQKSAEINERLKKEADESAAQAINAEAKAKKKSEELAALNKVVEAQIRAQKSLDIEDDLLRSIEALEAYKVNKDNDQIGNIRHPDIVKALYSVADNVVEDATYSKKQKRNLGAVKNIFCGENNVFYTSTTSGEIQRWVINQWNTIGVPELSKPKTMNFDKGVIYNDLAILNEYALVGGEVPYLQATNTKNGGRSVFSFQQFDDEVYDVAFNDMHKYIAGGNKSAWFWDGKKMKRYKKNTPSITNFFKIDEEGEHTLVSISGEYSYDNLGRPTYVVQAETFTQNIATVDTVNIPGSAQEINYGDITAAQHLNIADGVAPLLVLGFETGRILIWESDREGSLFGDEYSFKSHRAAIADISFTRDGRLMAVASYDGTVSVWDLSQRHNSAYLPMVFELEENAWAMSVEFSFDGQYLLAGDKNGSLYFWNINPDDYAFLLCEYVTQNYGTYGEQNIMEDAAVTIKGKVQRKQAEMSQQKVQEINKRVHNLKVICQ